MTNKDRLKSLVKSFRYAFRGLSYCIKTQRNMRIHLVAAAAVMLFSVIYGLTAIQYAILFLGICFVIVTEMLNTAVEFAINIQTDSYDQRAGAAKDIAAGAVLVATAAAVVTGLILFGDIAKLRETFYTIVSTVYYIIPAVLTVIFGLLFIFKGISMFERKSRSDKKVEKEKVKIYRPKYK
ncbi:MAG: diacylglycerol kinase family protein [Oscillospiraceae bacterium]|nr:diacylglycerol kinase family protein [Oscillospiraceae bacterium]